MFYKKLAKRRWLFWRIIVENVVDYKTAMTMSLDEIMEANAALNYKIELKNQAAKNKKK